MTQQDQGERRILSPRTPHSLFSDSKSATVFFDGGCPVCAREIALLRPRAEDVDFVDIAHTPPAGLDHATALARLHLRLPDGRMVSGAAAFAELWQRVPQLRWLGRFIGWAPITPIAELAYRGFLRARRLWR
jgi:predicted DCC family thiol-disulfide oxidoreductase YuxK